MQKIIRNKTITKDQKGVAVVMVALMLTLLIGVAAFAIDIGFRNVKQNELQNIADAAALAGAGELSRQYLDTNFTAVDTGAIVTLARNVATQNKADFIIENGDIEIGRWINNAFDPTPSTRPNAVKVTAKMTGAAIAGQTNGAIPTFFARIFNISSLDATADATAALTGDTTIVPGELELPVAISQEWYTLNDFSNGTFCDQNIQFYPTSGTDGCAGWNTYFDNTFDSRSPNADKLNDIIKALTDRTFESPGFSLKDNPMFEFTGGNLSNVQDSLVALYNSRCDENGVWQTKIVVYGANCGDNPNNTIPIVGVSTVEITGVAGPPPILIARVLCDEIGAGHGGGSYYGTWGSIPGLVE